MVQYSNGGDFTIWIPYIHVVQYSDESGVQYSDSYCIGLIWLFKSHCQRQNLEYRFCDPISKNLRNIISPMPSSDIIFFPFLGNLIFRSPNFYATMDGDLNNKHLNIRNTWIADFKKSGIQIIHGWLLLLQFYLKSLKKLLPYSEKICSKFI